MSAVPGRDANRICGRRRGVKGDGVAVGPLAIIETRRRLRLGRNDDAILQRVDIHRGREEQRETAAGNILRAVRRFRCYNAWLGHSNVAPGMRRLRAARLRRKAKDRFEASLVMRIQFQARFGRKGETHAVFGPVEAAAEPTAVGAWQQPQIKRTFYGGPVHDLIKSHLDLGREAQASRARRRINRNNRGLCGFEAPGIASFHFRAVDCLDARGNRYLIGLTAQQRRRRPEDVHRAVDPLAPARRRRLDS